MDHFTYKNQEPSMVILKCIGIHNFYLEKVIFPHEVYTFLAPEESHIEIWGINTYGPILEKRIRVSDFREARKMTA